jgi:hypothetical protein
MAKETILRDLLQQKRAYESLLALHRAGKYKSSSIEIMLKEHLQGVIASIDNLQHTTKNRSANAE